MLYFKYLSRFSLILLIALMATSAPLKVRAQDDMPDDSTFAPPPPTQSSPPVMIDDGDSNSAPDAEEYDG